MSRYDNKLKQAKEPWKQKRKQETMVYKLKVHESEIKLNITVALSSSNRDIQKCNALTSNVLVSKLILTTIYFNNKDE